MPSERSWSNVPGGYAPRRLKGTSQSPLNDFVERHARKGEGRAPQIRRPTKRSSFARFLKHQIDQ